MYVCCACMCIRMSIGVCLCVCRCVCAWHQASLWVTLHLTHWGRISHLNPRLTRTDNLASSLLKRCPSNLCSLKCWDHRWGGRKHTSQDALWIIPTIYFDKVWILHFLQASSTDSLSEPLDYKPLASVDFLFSLSFSSAPTPSAPPQTYILFLLLSFSSLPPSTGLRITPEAFLMLGKHLTTGL